MPKHRRMKDKKLKSSDYSQETFDTFSELNNDDSEKREVSINTIFQDDLLEQILVYLPIESIIKAGLVCKKWQKITTSKRFLWNASQTVLQKPWLLMCIDDYENELSCYAYDLVLQKWKGRDFLDMVKPYMFRDSCDGLVCYMNKYGIYVCNPITREHKMVQEVPANFSDYPVDITISVNRRSHSYKVAAVYIKRWSDSQSELSFQVYDSVTMKWSASHPEVLTGGWGIHFKRVILICNGIMYFLMYSKGGEERKLGLLAYNLSSNSSSHGTLVNSFIPVPCSFVVCGLLNLNEQLIIVGAIGKPGNPYLNYGFCIWVLRGDVWQEISRVAHTCFYNCDHLIFHSSGTEDLIYIHADYDSRLVVFDMSLKEWKSCENIPFADVSGGFCFQPRLDISP